MLRTCGCLERDARGLRGSELGRVVAGRRRRRLRGARPRVPALQAARRRGGRGAHGDVACLRRARLPRRFRRGQRLARRAPGACSTGSSRVRSTAGWRSSRATSPAAPAIPIELWSSRSRRRRSGGVWTCPTSRCSVWRSRVRRWSRAEVDEGMRRLDEATAAALEGEAAIPIAGAWAFCFLVTACSAVRDYERASEWCDRIAEFAESYGSRYMLAFCRAEYGGIHLWRGTGWRPRRCSRPRSRTSRCRDLP